MARSYGAGGNLPRGAVFQGSGEALELYRSVLYTSACIHLVIDPARAMGIPGWECFATVCGHEFRLTRLVAIFVLPKSEKSFNLL